MVSHHEERFAKLIQIVVTSLIKNAERPPEAMLQAALDCEAHLWPMMDRSVKLERLQEVAAYSINPSPVYAFFDSYPHPFSRKRFQDYVETLAAYQNELQEE